MTIASLKRHVSKAASAATTYVTLGLATAVPVLTFFATVPGALAQETKPAADPAQTEAKPAPAAKSVPYAMTGELAKASPLGEQWLGSPDAPVTIVEYASMTCTHCAAFHETGYQTLKTKYIDTGKVRFTLREFPFDPVATAAFMLARCSGDGHYLALTDALFKQQKVWAFSENPQETLFAAVKQAGFTQDSFQACLKDQRIYDAVNDVRIRGEKLGVDSTPTFFINGKKVSGALSAKDLDAQIEPLLK